MKVTMETKLEDLLELPEFKEREYMLNPLMGEIFKEALGDNYGEISKGRSYAEFSLEEMNAFLPAWTIPSIQKGWEYLVKKSEEQCLIYDFWNNEARKEDTSKEKTGLMAFVLQYRTNEAAGYYHPMTDLTHEGSREKLLGANFSAEDVKVFSVEKQVTECYPETFIWYCDADALVPAENSKMLIEQIKMQGIACQCEVYEGDAHGWGTGDDTPTAGWLSRAVNFWEKQWKYKE